MIIFINERLYAPLSLMLACAGRAAAPKLTDPEEIKRRNQAALEKRKVHW